MGSNIEIAGRPIIFFDGVCNLCNGAVQFIIKRDPDANFTFSSLQSSKAHEVLNNYDVNSANLESILLVEDGRIYKKSDAILRIGSRLGSPWSFGVIFKVIPKSLRDMVYDWVARNRYAWFGKKDECMLPTAELSARFLE